MILSKEAGSRFQMDLIDMPEFHGYNHILRVVDHLSKFGYVYPLKTKTSEEVGKSLLCILATSIMPKILQSDNGGEVSLCLCLLHRLIKYGFSDMNIFHFSCRGRNFFRFFLSYDSIFSRHQFLGYCVSLINKEFPWVHIVKGKPRKPSTQGSVEVSHKAFKSALVKWLDKEKRENPMDRNAGQDWIVGASVVQCEINNSPMKARNHTTPHMIYFGKINKNSYSAALGQAHKVAQSEYGLRLAKRVLEQVKKVDPEKMITQKQVEKIIECGDSIWDEVCVDPEVDAGEMLSVAFYSMLDEIGVTLPNNVELVEDAEILPDVEWQPDDLPAYVHGTNDLVTQTGEEGSYFTRKYIFLSNR